LHRSGGNVVRITKSEEYGLRLVLRLASEGGQLTIRELAELEHLPEPTVAKVIARLRRSGIVIAERGRNGGYALGRPAAELTVARVVGAIDEGMYDASFCDRMAPGGEACTRSRNCGIRPVWRGLTAVIGNFLNGITVAELIENPPPKTHGLPVAAGQRG
jgi:Rrf2 family protein